jgi:hypothetical protein
VHVGPGRDGVDVKEAAPVRPAFVADDAHHGDRGMKKGRSLGRNPGDSDVRSPGRHGRADPPNFSGRPNRIDPPARGRTTPGNTKSEHRTSTRQEGDNLQRQCPPPRVCDSHPINPDEPPPTAHDSPLQGREPIANQVIQRPDPEAVCQHERLCAAGRRAGEYPQCFALIGG